MQDHSKLKGSIQVDEASVNPIEHMTGKKNSFGIFKPKMAPIYLLADSPDEMKKWISALTADSKCGPLAQESFGILGSIEAMNDPAVISNSLGKICGWNLAAEKLFGYSKQEAIGQDLTILMPKPYSEIHHNFLTNYKKTGKRKLIGVARKLPAMKKDGTIISMELSLGELPFTEGASSEDQKQKLPRWIAIMRELTTGPSQKASSSGYSNNLTTEDSTESEDYDEDNEEQADSDDSIPQICPFSGKFGNADLPPDHPQIPRSTSTPAGKNASTQNTISSSSGSPKCSGVQSPLSKEQLISQNEILRCEISRLMENLAIVTKEKELLEMELKEYKNGHDDSNLEKLLKDEGGYNALLAFCMKEHTEENVMFWKFVEDYKQTLYVQDLRDKAQFIYDTYVAEDAPSLLNIDAVRREFLKRAIVDPTRETFASLQRQILNNLAQDSFVRFAGSEKGKAFIDKFFSRQKLLQQQQSQQKPAQWS